MKYLIGIGEILFDCLPSGKKLGGAPANFAYHATQCGRNGCVVSAIGNDNLGDEIVRILDNVQMRHQLERVNYPTGTVQISLSKGGIPQYEICEGVAYDNIPYTKELANLAKNAEAVCFGTLAQRSPVSRATIQKVLDDACDALRVFDINLRENWYSNEVIVSSLARANILKINDEELNIVAPMLLENDEALALRGTHLAADRKCTTEICRRLISKFGLQMLILTCGAEGSFVFSANEISEKKTPKVKVVDTVGAGDSFTAAFISQILNGKSIAEAHERAVEVSAYVCTQHGAMPKYVI